MAVLGIIVKRRWIYDQGLEEARPSSNKDILSSSAWPESKGMIN
jgi:hypothetical protein